VFVLSSDRKSYATGDHAAGDELDVAAGFPNHLAPGRYWISAQVAEPGGGELLAFREDVYSFVVTGAAAGGGTLDLPHNFEFTPAPSMQEAANER
jgi:hypothetical protein